MPGCRRVWVVSAHQKLCWPCWEKCRSQYARAPRNCGEKRKFSLSRKEFYLATQKELNRHERAMKKLNEGLAAFRETCSHNGSTTFHGDPAGGNDSWNECDICGVDIWAEYLKSRRASK